MSNNDYFGSDHIFRFMKDSLIIERKSMTRTIKIQEIEYVNIVDIGYHRPKKRSFLVGLIIDFFLFLFSALLRLPGSNLRKYVSVKYLVGDDVAVSNYETVLKPGNIEEMKSLLNSKKSKKNR